MRSWCNCKFWFLCKERSEQVESTSLIQDMAGTEVTAKDTVASLEEADCLKMTDPWTILSHCGPEPALLVKDLKHDFVS